LRVLLVDGDISAYTCSFTEEVALEVEPGYWTWHCDFNKVADSIDSYMDYLKDHLKADEVKLCLSDNESNFRKLISPTYKGKRSKVKRPLVLKPIREWLIKERGAIVKDGLEGDDVMGIMATFPTDNEMIICSIDKDMKTIPGKYYRDSEAGVVDISEEEADYYHLYQTLVGDVTDGYSGCPGVGPVAAKKELDKSPTWETVLDQFLKKGLTEDDALVQARMARILRTSDYNFETKTPIMWTPKELKEVA